MPKIKRRRQVDVELPERVTVEFEKELRELISSSKTLYGGAAWGYLSDEMWSKYLDSNLVHPKSRATAAIHKFLAAEDRNADTNLRLTMLEATEKHLGWVSFGRLVKEARRFVQHVLGELRYPDILKGSVFTNGASTRVRRGPAAAVLKLTGELQITNSALKHWFAMASNTKLSKVPLSIVESSVLFTVPKKTEIDRCACKEPEGNALLQRAVGIHIRKRLRRVGINLLDQTRNQRLAREGSITGKLATVDLSSASDTMSSGIVRLLLPFDWWSLLVDLRCETVVIPQDVLPDPSHSFAYRQGTAHSLEMFSSMGNGFTFELETLLFWALAQATRKLSGFPPGTISVYGDDIIVPVTWVRRYLRVLGVFGFIPNTKKTLVTGPLRESCGRHYWKGFDVTPFYIRKAVTTLPELINTLNHLLEWDGRGWGFFTTEECYKFWDRWREYVPHFLWGGITPEDNSALVTGDLPRKRLVAVTERVRVPQWAGMITWLHRGDLGPQGVERNPFEVDPAEVAWFEARPLVAAGERTSWDPGAAFAAR